MSATVENSELPTHIGFILDGNRRWAKDQGLPTLEGHRKGYENLKTIGEAAFEMGIQYVSAYIFSTENWNRSKEEVGYLMDLVLKIATKDLQSFIDKNIKIVFLGSDDKVPSKVLKAIQESVRKSSSNTGGTLALCFNYGGKKEIVDAVKRLAQDGADLRTISEEQLSSALYQPHIPPVDFLIRTSGEQRLSNFMLWRVAYAELYFVEKHWPAFSTDDLEIALSEYANRQRRFGV